MEFERDLCGDGNRACRFKHIAAGAGPADAAVEPAKRRDVNDLRCVGNFYRMLQFVSDLRLNQLKRMARIDRDPQVADRPRCGRYAQAG
jgi:hypothetical protein